jgi:hypothetical protein
MLSRETQGRFAKFQIPYYHATNFHFHVSKYNMPVVAYNNYTSSCSGPIRSPCYGFSHTSPEPYTCTIRSCPNQSAIIVSLPLNNKELHQYNSLPQATQRQDHKTQSKCRNQNNQQT